MGINQSRSSSEKGQTQQVARVSNNQVGITFRDWSTVPPKLRASRISDELDGGKTFKENGRENQMLEELTKNYSQASPQVGSTAAPQIKSRRRSPVNLISSRSGSSKDDLRGFIPELNIHLDCVKHLSSGVLEFNQEVRDLCANGVILEELPHGGCPTSPRVVYKNDDFTKGPRLEREKKLSVSYSSIRDSWSYEDNATPYPSLDPIFVQNRITSRLRHHIGIHFPEATVAVQDLGWGVRKGHQEIPDDARPMEWGSRKRFSWSRNMSEYMLRRASVWIDDGHQILGNFEVLKALLEPGSEIDADGNKNILRNHLMNRRWVWITRMSHNKRVIDIPRTEEFYDARFSLSKGGARLLQNFCDRRQCSEREIDKQPVHIRGKLQQLMIMSQVAGTMMTTASDMRKHRSAGNYGPWLDFLEMSVVDGNEQLLMALQELEIARYFISKSRFAVTESTVYRLWELPEHQDVEEDAHWPKDTIKALQNKTSHKKPTRHRSTTLDRHHSRRTKLALTHWQSTGEILYTMQAFSPQSEAGCALTLILHRQELAVLRRESRERASQRKSSVVRLGRCRCASDTCYEPESSSKESSPVPGVEISVEPPGTPTSAPPNGCFRAAVGAALSTISEERSRTTTPRLEQCISMNSVSDTTLFGLATPPDAPPSIDINGPPPQVVIAGGAPIGRITPPNDLSASPAAEVEPQHNFAVESSAVTGLQNGVQEAQGIDNEQPTSCATPPELPSIPPNVPEVMNVPDPIEQSASPKTQAVNPSQNGTMNCPTAEEIEVSKQTAEPEAIAEDLDGAAEGVQTKTSLLKKQERGDSGYGSMCPSQNEDGVKLDPKSGILKGDCCGLRPKMVYWFGLYRWTDTSDYTLLIMD